jgi:hypothetical protein
MKSKVSVLEMIDLTYDALLDSSLRDHAPKFLEDLAEMIGTRIFRRLATTPDPIAEELLATLKRQHKANQHLSDYNHVTKLCDVCKLIAKAEGK